MYVIGATKSSFLKEVRTIVPDSFLLIPGVGAQGGDLEETFKNGVNKNIGILVNSSRSIIYAGNDKDFLEKSYIEAKRLQAEDGIRDSSTSRGLGDVYKRQLLPREQKLPIL